MGDGEMAPQSIAPPTAFAAPGYLDRAVPVEMYQTITAGRVAKGMPPFGPGSTNPLAERERWSLIAAIYALGTPSIALESGAQVYETSCAVCHGAAGESRQAGGPNSLARLAYWAGLSDEQVRDRLMGITDHTFNLTPIETASVVRFARLFGYLDEEALRRGPELRFVIQGTVMNGSTGGNVNEPLGVELRIFDGGSFAVVASQESLTTADGRFQFELSNVPADQIAMVSVEYGGLSFSSDVARLTPGINEIQLPLTVFDQIRDPSVIQINQFHLSLDRKGDQVQVSEFFQFDNNSQAVFTGESGRPEDGVLHLLIPPAAENIVVRRGLGRLDSFVPADGVQILEDRIEDTWPVRPGPAAHILLIEYSLPVASKLTIEHRIPYPVVSGSVVSAQPLLSETPPPGWELVSEPNGVDWRATNLAAGSAIEIQLDGRQPASFSRSDLIWLILGGLILGSAAAWYYFSSRRRSPFRMKNILVNRDYSQEGLNGMLADLDVLFEAGGLTDWEYRKRRQRILDELKAIRGG